MPCKPYAVLNMIIGFICLHIKLLLDHNQQQTLVIVITIPVVIVLIGSVVLVFRLKKASRCNSVTEPAAAPAPDSQGGASGLQSSGVEGGPSKTQG